MGDANTVEMRIQVVDGGTSAVINKVTSELTGLDAAAARTGASMSAAGVQSEVAGAKIAAGARIGAAGMGDFRGKTELARLALEDFGVSGPRYISRLIAENQVLMGVMSSMTGLFVGIAAISMFGMAIKEAKEFYHAHLDVNAAMDDYRKKAGETAQQDLFNNASIETTLASLKEINAQIDRIEGTRANVEKYGIGVGPQGAQGNWKSVPKTQQQRDFENFDPVAAGQEEAKLSAAKDLFFKRALDQQDELKKRQLDSDRQLYDSKHENHAKQDRLFAQQAADLDKGITQRKEWENFDAAAIYQNQQRAKGTAEKDLITLPKISPEAGTAVQKQAYGDAGIQYQIASTEQGKKDADQRKQWIEEETRMRNEAANAGISGEVLYASQVKQQEDEIREKIAQNMGFRETGLKEIGDLDAKYHAERMKRAEESQHETEKMQASAQLAGTTGVERIRLQGAGRAADIDWDVSHNGLDPQAASKRRASVEQETNQEIAKDYESFSERVRSLTDASADHQAGAYARIRSEAKRELDQLDKDFQEHVKGLDKTSPEYGRYLAQDITGRAATAGSAGTQVRTLNEQNEDETRKLEADANRKSMRPEQQKTQQIIDEYNERTLALQREYDKEKASAELHHEDMAAIEENYDRRMVAANKEMNGELAQNNKEQRDKLAGQLEGLFKKPQDYFKNLGTHMMAQSAAAVLLRAQKEMGLGGAPSPEDGAQGTHTMRGGILGSILGGDWLRGKGAQIPGFAPAGHSTALPSTASHLSSLTSLSITSASISVQSATISGAAGAGGPRGAFASGGTGAESPAFSGTSAASVSRSGGGSSGGAEVTGFGDSILYGGGLGSSPGGSGGTGASIASAAGAAGASMPGRGASGVLGDISGTMALYSQVKSTFSGAAGTNAPASNGYFKPTQASIDGNYSSSDSTKLPTGMTGAQGMAAFQGGMGLYGAAMSTGGFGGALGGAMSGAELGTAIMPGIGTAIGAAGGAILGAIGFGGRMAAESYWEKQVKPQMEQTDQSFSTGTMDYLTAYNAINTLETQAQKATSKMGPSAGGYYHDTIKPALDREMAMFTREARAGRAQFSMSGAQFHSGGVIDDFGDLATSSNEGFIHAMKGEIVMRNAENPPSLSSAGNSTMLDADSSKMQPLKQGDSHFHFHTPDAKSAHRFFMDNIHSVRAALNRSYAEYSGGSDAGF